MDNKIAISFAIVVYEDGTHQAKINLIKGKENFAASIIFSMMSGQMATGTLKIIEEDYPKSYEKVKNEVERLYNIFSEKLAEINHVDPNLPVIRATQVFGGGEK